MARIKIDGYRCERCNYEWAPRNKEQEPRVCPNCKSPYWNVPRKKQSVKQGNAGHKQTSEEAN